MENADVYFTIAEKAKIKKIKEEEEEITKSIYTAAQAGLTSVEVFKEKIKYSETIETLKNNGFSYKNISKKEWRYNSYNTYIEIKLIRISWDSKDNKDSESKKRKRKWF